MRMLGWSSVLLALVLVPQVFSQDSPASAALPAASASSDMTDGPEDTSFVDQSGFGHKLISKLTGVY